MTKKIKISELAEFDASEYLNSEEEVAAYLTAVLEEDASELQGLFFPFQKSFNASQSRFDSWPR